VLLVLVGVAALVDNVSGVDFGSFVPLGIGLAFLVAWATTGQQGFLIPGGILTGVGTGVVLDAALDLDGSIVPLCLGAGFCLITALGGRERQTWPLIPGGILAAVGLAGVVDTAGWDVSADVTHWILPSAVIGAGLLVIFHRTVPRQLVPILIGLLVLAAAVGVGLAGWDIGRVRVSETRALDLPSLEGRVLRVEAGSGDVAIRTGDAGSAALLEARGGDEDDARARLRDTDVIVAEQDGLVVVRLGDADGVSVSFRLQVPRGTDIQVEVGSGQVDVDGAGGVVALVAGSGDISFSGTALELDAETGSGDLTVAYTGRAALRTTLGTGSGEVAFAASGRPAFDVETSSGDIEVFGFDESGDSEDAFRADGTDGSVVIRTGSGDVTLTEVKPA